MTTTDEETKPHLSASQLGTLETCGEAYRFRYLEGLKIPPGALMHAGTGTHKSAEKDLRHKIAEGELLPDDVIPDLARDATLTSIEEGGMLVETGQSISDAKGTAVDRAVRLAELHHAEVAPGLNPTHVERKFRVRLDGFPRDLIGFIDVQEKGRIRDLKTASKSKNQKDVDTSEQLTAYAAGYLAVEGVLPDAVILDVLVDLKTPKPQTLVSTRNTGDISMLLRRMERAVTVIESGAFMPASADHWKCSAKWCGYFSRCAFSKRPVSASMAPEGK